VLAAGSSFLSFAVGACLPVLPYLLGATNLWPAALLAAVGLFIAGALVSRVTARSWWYGGLRQLILGGAAAVITFAVGSLIGTNTV
jgi:VIT1/CCC1 family predicted Fe2+/Mn2+ transporter